MKIFYALAVMMVLAFGLAPSAMAHSMAMQGDCPQAASQTDDAAPAQVSAAQAEAPCKTDCPTDHHKASKDGCCMSAASCHSIGVMNSAAMSTGVVAKEAKVVASIAVVHTSALVAGPQKPPQYS